MSLLKNLFAFFLGCLVGIVVMGGIVFVLQSNGRMDQMPLIMLACILILVVIGVICYVVVKRKAERNAEKRARS